MTDPLEIILRLFLGALLGGVIGFERQSHGHPAGFRTHLLVSLASVLIMIISTEYYHLYSLSAEVIRIDPARIAAGALTGIGFLGAGVIIKSGFSVQGLTTAACLWAVSAIGLAVGGGLYMPATITFLITITALWALWRVELKVPRLKYKLLTVTTAFDINESEITDILSEAGVAVGNIDYEVDRVKSERTSKITIKFKDSSVIPRLVERISELSSVKQLHLRG